MALYELSIDAQHVLEAERLIQLEGREFPTLVMTWESRLFEQPWDTTIVTDYTLALPPQTVHQPVFHPVRLAAFTGGTPTKYFYFGTEMSENVPRIAPEMENLVSTQGSYQEFILDETSCPISYVKLIQTTPRIYGNGPQDYYAPPIKVERFDGVTTPEHLADAFPLIVANLPQLTGPTLVDGSKGVWKGARYVGTRAIAILRQGKVVGLHRRSGRIERDEPPPDVPIRDPKGDIISQEWVGIDVGARSTVIGFRGPRSGPELLRLGTTEAPVVQADFENPSEVLIDNIGRALKAWRDRVVQPMTRFEDICVGLHARRRRSTSSSEIGRRAAATITPLTFVRESIEREQPYRMVGATDPTAGEPLKKPAPPVIDEEGIGAHDPFDPIEHYAYHVGLHTNYRLRGIHLKYALTMPTGWSAARRLSVLMAYRRGIFRSLPAGLVEYHDTEQLQVVDAGVSAISYLAHSVRAFSIQHKDAPVNVGVFEAGASEAGVLFGILRDPTGEERSEGHERIIEHLEPQSMPWFGAERLLHRLAYRVYVASLEQMTENGIPFELPPEEEPAPGAEDLLTISPEARANVVLLKDRIRPVLEGDATARLSSSAKLLAKDNLLKDVMLTIERPRLRQALDGWFGDAAKEFANMVAAALKRIARGSDPYDGFRVILGGRMSMHVAFADMVQKALPQHVRVHRFREPDRTNVNAPTVKTATTYGLLVLKNERVGVKVRSEQRNAFRYRVGRSRHGQLAEVLDPSIEYDVWREMGACTKPEVEVRYMIAVDDVEVAADDPRVMRSICFLGPDAIGRRLYLRAISTTQVQVASGPPGGDPDDVVRPWLIDLTTGIASPC